MLHIIVAVCSEDVEYDLGGFVC